MNRPLLKLLTTGTVISFAGSLPPGLMNIVAVQTTVGEGMPAGVNYAAGATVAEMLVLWILLVSMNWLNRHKYFFVLLEWLTACLLVIFAVASFWAAGSRYDLAGLVSRPALPVFLSGFLLSLLNPMHIPFWLGWSGYLFSGGTLESKPGHYYFLCLGVGLGAMGGYLLYIKGGVYLFALIRSFQLPLYLLLGFMLLVAAFTHIRKMFQMPWQVRYAANRQPEAASTAHQ